MCAGEETGARAHPPPVFHARGRSFPARKSIHARGASFASMSLLAAAATLRDACGRLALDDVPYIYNPLDYAWEAHAEYVLRYGAKEGKRVLLVGMNPGPHGMAQTGVPFGDVHYVRDWMGIEKAPRQPERTHPKRPVTGFATKRREPSGTRLYGWAEARYQTAERFFREFFIANYCPLLFYDEMGRNLTPPQLGKFRMEAVYEVCDAHLAAVIAGLDPAFVVGVGAFAEERARRVVDAHKLPPRVGTILHPSPASPAANRGWAPQAEAQLRALGAL